MSPSGTVFRGKVGRGSERKIPVYVKSFGTSGRRGVEKACVDVYMIDGDGDLATERASWPDTAWEVWELVPYDGTADRSVWRDRLRRAMSGGRKLASFLKEATSKPAGSPQAVISQASQVEPVDEGSILPPAPRQEAGGELVVVRVPDEPRATPGMCCAQRSAKKGGGNCGSMAMPHSNRCAVHHYLVLGPHKCAAKVGGARKQCKQLAVRCLDVCPHHLEHQPCDPGRCRVVEASGAMCNERRARDRQWCVYHAADADHRNLREASQAVERQLPIEQPPSPPVEPALPQGADEGRLERVWTQEDRNSSRQSTPAPWGCRNEGGVPPTNRDRHVKGAGVGQAGSRPIHCCGSPKGTSQVEGAPGRASGLGKGSAGNGNRRHGRGGSKKQAVAVVHHRNKHGNDSGRHEVTSTVHKTAFRHAGRGSSVDTVLEDRGEKGKRGEGLPAATSDGAGDKEGGRGPDTGGDKGRHTAGVAHGGALRMCPPTQARERDYQGFCDGSSVPAREGCPVQRPVHGPYVGAGGLPPYGDGLHSGQAPLYSPVCRDKWSEYQNGTQGSGCCPEQQTGTEVFAEGCVDGTGRSRGERAGPSIVFGPYKCDNFAPLPRLGGVGPSEGYSPNGSPDSVHGFRMIHTLNELGRKAPQASELGLAGRGGEGFDAPLKVKDVCARLKWDELDRLEMALSTRERLNKAKQWIEPSAAYDLIKNNLHLIAGRAMNTIDAADMDLMRRVHKIGVLKEPPVAYVQAFTVVEGKFSEELQDYKLARRAIFAPLINDVIKLLGIDVSVAFKTKNETRIDISVAEVGEQYDLQSAFDQLGYDERVHPFYTIPGTDPPEALRVASMGGCGNPELADAVLEALTPYPMPMGVQVTRRIDNILFTGDREQVEETGRLFRKRCVSCGIVLNDSVGAQTEYEFLGEAYWHKAGDDLAKRGITKKTAWKLNGVKRALGEQSTFTPRRVAAFYGLLLFASETLRILPANYHFAMRALRDMASLCALGSMGWNSPVCIDDALRTDLLRWTTQCLEMNPVPAILPLNELLFDIYVDASEIGWGAVICRAGSSEVRTIALPWSEDDRSAFNLASSVTAEPLAVLRALCMTCSPGVHGRVRVHTDHQPIVWAAHKGHGKAFMYSYLLSKIDKTLGNWQVEFSWIPGVNNPADVLSRSPLLWEPPVMPVTSVAGKSVDFRRG